MYEVLLSLPVQSTFGLVNMFAIELPFFFFFPLSPFSSKFVASMKVYIHKQEENVGEDG